MSENTTTGPSGNTSSALPVKGHESYSSDRKGKGAVTAHKTGPEGSKGLPGKIVNNVKGSDK